MENVIFLNNILNVTFHRINKFNLSILNKFIYEVKNSWEMRNPFHQQFSPNVHNLSEIGKKNRWKINKIKLNCFKIYSQKQTIIFRIQKRNNSLKILKNFQNNLSLAYLLEKIKSFKENSIKKTARKNYKSFA